MSELAVFYFKEGTKVRTLEREGEIWFVAKDVCDILGLKNPSDALKDFPENEILKLGSTEFQDSRQGEWGGASSYLCVNEPGLYRLIFQSRKPEAEAFKTWVFTEVLPSIRKTGAYSLLEKDHRNLQNVYRQMENYRMKYISLLDKLESRGITIKEIWELCKVDRDFIAEYAVKMISDDKSYRKGRPS